MLGDKYMLLLDYKMGADAPIDYKMVIAGSGEVILEGYDKITLEHFVISLDKDLSSETVKRVITSLGFIKKVGR